MNEEDKIQFCLGRIKAAEFMICEGDKRCEDLLLYILRDINERLLSGQGIYAVLDSSEQAVRYYIERDYPDCRVCWKAWHESFRTIRYCLKRQFLQQL